MTLDVSPTDGRAVAAVRMETKHQDSPLLQIGHRMQKCLPQHDPNPDYVLHVAVSH